MALIAKNILVKEDILNENGEKIGEIKFNPNDGNIIYKLGKIVKDLTTYIDKVKNMEPLPNIQKEEPKTSQEFEQMATAFNKINERLEIEDEAISNVFEELKNIFGEETINLFTMGTKDIDSIMPLIDFVIPYVENARKNKVNKYVNVINDVME